MRGAFPALFIENDCKVFAHQMNLEFIYLLEIFWFDAYKHFDLIR